MLYISLNKLNKPNRRWLVVTGTLFDGTKVSCPEVYKMLPRAGKVSSGLIPYIILC